MEQQYNLARELHEHTAELRRQDLNSVLLRWSQQAKPLEKPSLPNRLAKVEDGIPQWLASLELEGKSQETIDLYRQCAVNYLRSDPNPTALSVQANLGARLKRFSAHDIQSHQKALKSLFKFLVKHNLWPENPVADMPLTKAISKEVECPSDEAIQKLLEAKLYRARDEVKFKTVLMLALDTGLRMNEVCTLERRNTDLVHLELKVLGKGGKERTVVISQETGDMLRAWLKKAPESKWVFPGTDPHRHWSYSTFEVMLKQICGKLGIDPPIHPHQLRHYYATRALESGAKLEIVARNLGHSTPTMTAQVYRHVKVAEQHEEHAKHGPLRKLRERQQNGGLT